MKLRMLIIEADGFDSLGDSLSKLVAEWMDEGKLARQIETSKPRKGEVRPGKVTEVVEPETSA